MKNFGEVRMDKVRAEEPLAEDPSVNGAVNWIIKYGQMPQDLAGATSKTFLGLQIQCAQCHNHKSEKWTQADFRGFASAFAHVKFEVLDKDTKVESLAKLLEPIGEGKNIGLLSESGCPGVADPGALAVQFAHEHQITVVPLVGPSSILLALMASGLNGQRFAFHGYLPIDSKEAVVAIKNLERESREKNQTQIFIETPYRNSALMGHLIKSLRPDTRLCIAVDLTSTREKIICKEVLRWKAEPVSLEKVPTVFLFLAAS